MALDALGTALNSGPSEVRRAAESAIAMIVGDATPRLSLDAALEGTSSLLLRQRLLLEIGHRGDTSVLPELLDSLSSSEETDLAIAVKILSLAPKPSEANFSEWRPIIRYAIEVTHDLEPGSFPPGAIPAALLNPGPISSEPLIMSAREPALLESTEVMPAIEMPLLDQLGLPDPQTRRSAAKRLARQGDVRWRAIVQGDDEDLTRLSTSGFPDAARSLLAGATDGLGSMGSRADPNESWRDRAWDSLCRLVNAAGKGRLDEDLIERVHAAARRLDKLPPLVLMELKPL